MAAGVKIKAMTLFLGRLYHRSSGEIVDVFAIDGDHVKEISDDEVKNKFNPEKSNKALEDIILAKYEKEILKLRADIVKDYTQTLSSAIYSSIKTLVPPAEVTKIFEEKEGKLKKVIFNDCFEKKLNYGGFYCDLFAESSVGDKMRFVKAGSAYLTEDKKLQKIF